MSGNLFIISAPSGTGKTTLLKEIMADLPGLAFSVSHTTRAPREGEENGRDYFFTDRETFARMRDENAFLEWAEVHGNFYGTSRQAIEDQLAAGLDIFLDIDVQGANQLRSMALNNAIFLFIAPPSWDELAARLTGRATDNQETINLRLENAKTEMQDADSYDYIVINDKIPEAVATLKSIIVAERCKGRRSAVGTPFDVKGLIGAVSS